MTDAWTVSLSGDVSSYGLSGQITYTEGVLSSVMTPIINAVTGICGNSIGQGMSTLGPVPQTTFQYAQAYDILTNGHVQTSLNNVDPIVFVSYAPSRAQMLGFMQGTTSFPGLKARDGGTEFGDGGWKASDILHELMTIGGGSSLNIPNSFLMALSTFDYHIGYYRVEPYADILGEFKKLFAGIPVIMQFNVQTMVYEPKLPPLCMAYSINYAAQTNISVKFTPEKKVSIIVHGGLGKPDTDSDYYTTNTIHYEQVCPNIVMDTPFPMQWGQATPEGKIFKQAVIFNTDMVGSVNGDTKLDYTVKTSTFTDTPETGSDLVNTLRLSGERHEVLSKIGTPISTIWSKTQRLHLNMSNIAYGLVAGGKEVTTYTTNRVKLFSHGESAMEVQAVNLVSRTLTVSTVEDENNPGIIKRMPVAYHVKFDLYEDIFSNTKTAISASASQGVGRKMQEVSIQYAPFVVSTPAWSTYTGSGNLVDIQPLTERHDFSTLNKTLVFFEVNRTTRHFDPLGTSGYKSTIVIITTNPMDSMSQSIDVQDAGDAANYASVTPIGPGYAKIVGKYGEGEPVPISIPVVVKSEALHYAHNVHDYHNGYYQITKIHEQPICADTPDYTHYIGAFEQPGIMGAYGLVVSVNQTVTPFKCTTTTTYRYYSC